MRGPCEPWCGGSPPCGVTATCASELTLGLWDADRVSRSKRVALDALIAEATVDCYNDTECVTGFYTMLDEHLDVPFSTVVLGVDVTVGRVELTLDEQITVVCTRDRSTQRIPILDLPLPKPAPAGAEWIDAYRRWVRGT